VAGESGRRGRAEARAGRCRERRERGQTEEARWRPVGGAGAGGGLQELLDRIAAREEEGREERRWFREEQARGRGRAVRAYLGAAAAGAVGGGGGRAEAAGGAGAEHGAGAAERPGAGGAEGTGGWARRKRGGAAAHGGMAAAAPQQSSGPARGGGGAVNEGGKRKRSGEAPGSRKKRRGRREDGGKEGGSGDGCGTTALGQDKLTAQDVLAAKMHAVVCEMRARQQRRADRKRDREAAAADGGTAPTGQNGDVRKGTLHATMHTISNFRVKSGITTSKQPRATGKKVRTPRIQYAQVYPEKTSPEQEEGVWDGRPKRARVAEGSYDQVKRRGTRARYEDEEPRVVKRRKVAMVPVGATAVNRMRDG